MPGIKGGLLLINMAVMTPEPAIKDGKGKRSCLLDGEKRSVEDALKENEMIPGGWNRQRESQQYSTAVGPVEGTLQEEMIPGG